MQRWIDSLLNAITGGNLLERTTALLLGGWALAPLVRFTEQFLWSDWEFAGFLAVLVTLDTLAGGIRAYRCRSLSARGFSRLFLKLMAYVITLVTLHVLAHHTIDGQPNTVLGKVVPFFDALAYAAIHENLAALGFPLLPRRLLRHFAQFVEEGRLPPEPPSSSSSNPSS